MANSYTVNLPQTDFPMRADLPKREPQLLELWQQLDLYRSFQDFRHTKGKFILHDGPPYANGDIHLGHAFNKIIKDTINKSKLLEGYQVAYVPGWDCHGLPIELNVEKKLGKPGVKVSVTEFIDACRKYAAEQIERQKAGFKRLGVIADWENYYYTMDFHYEANIIRALMTMVKDGYLVRGYKPVHWCTECKSALAEAEVEYRDVTSSAIDVKFRVQNIKLLDVQDITSAVVPIWTTTPWTLPANEAVSVNPDLTYCLVKCQTLQENLIIAEELLDSALARYGEAKYQVIKRYLGKELAGLELIHPLFTNKIVPLILGEHVTAEMGTGAVHTAPAHGMDDYLVGLRYNLPIRTPVGADGRYAPDTLFAGEEIFAANPLVIEYLQKQHNLLAVNQLVHSYPHCWRHKTKLIFRATEQWFISLDRQKAGKVSLREQALAAIDQVEWIPTQGENSIRSMVAQRPEWCISRQRFWGVPITLFLHRTTEEIHPEMQRLVEEIILPEIEKQGLGYWHQVDVEQFLKQYAHHPEDAGMYTKVIDTLDVWFNSGVSHYCVLQAREDLKYPADVYFEGVDQYRGWFQSSLLASLALNGQAPYRTVISHGFSVDSQGHKMSKSLGNVISPQEIIQKYGADILRWWACSNYLHDDIAASNEIFARCVDGYRLIRNTARFLLGNLADFNPVQDLVPVAQLLALDQFALGQVYDLVQEVRAAYESYQFHNACILLRTTLTDLSNFYFSIIKDRLYTVAVNAQSRRSAQTVLYYILENLVRILAPILSFTAEEIWQQLRQWEEKQDITTRVESVFYALFTDNNLGEEIKNVSNIFTALEWKNLRLIRDEVNKVLEAMRAAKAIGSSLAAEVTLYVDPIYAATVAKLRDELRFLLITSTAEYQPLDVAPHDAIATALPGLRIIALPAQTKKCARCWHYRADVGTNAEHPDLCGRCVENLHTGEVRRYI